jgi:TetR/AcrR family transcriptional repressor of nem operon
MNSELSPKASEIVACARSLLAVGGYNGFSYADIAEAVHISKPSVHHHFASKAELVRTVVERYREDARAGMAALERQIADPLAQLHAYVGYWTACIRDGTAPFCICAMLAAEMPAIPPEVAAEVRGHFADLAAWLEAVLDRGVADGVFHLRNPAKAEAMAVMASVHGAMLAARAHGDPELFGTIMKPVLHRLTHH